MSSINKYLPSEVTIFPNIPSDVQKMIISQCSPGGLVKLSGVNKEASKLLTNEVFKKLYNDQHPDLAPYGRLFSKLRSIHPSNCWKVASQVMDPDWEGHQHDNTVSIASSLSHSFHQEAISDVLAMKLRREKNMERMKEICGTHFEDPHSPIDQAYKEYKKHEQESNSLYQELVQTTQQINNEMSLDEQETGISVTLEETQSIRADIKGDLDGDDFEGYIGRFLNMSYEEFVEKTDVGRKGMSKDHFLLHQKNAKKALILNRIGQKLQSANQRKEEVWNKYVALDAERVRCQYQIANADSRVNQFKSQPAVAHIDELTIEWKVALDIKQNIKSKPHLEKCLTLIQKLIDSPIEQTPEACAEIRSLINACADRYRIKIWKYLYDQCANRVIEDSWAENHFQNYLPKLYTIVKDEFCFIRNSLDMADRSYKFPSFFVPPNLVSV